jgi:FkbM family methyltransferase
MNSIINLARFFASHPLTRQAPFSSFVRLIAWQIRSCLQDEVIVPWISGQRLAVRRGMTGATGNIYTGLHEFPDMMFLLHFLRRDDLFIDIGANVGTYTVLASGVCKANTWAFEPDPETVRHLNRNIEINDLNNLVRVYNSALGASEKDVQFTIGLDTQNRIVTLRDSNTRTVRQHSLDKLIDDKWPIMIKIDVEGYEEEVLCGAQRALANQALQVLGLETVTPQSKVMLADHRFERVYYDPFVRKLSQDQVKYPSSNSLYVRDLKSVTARLADADPIVIRGRAI